MAAGILQDLEQRWCVQGDGGALSSEERALWSRVAFALALFHDCGKVLDVEVEAPEGRGTWNPLEEPLASFKYRLGLPFPEKTPYRYRRGRGLHGHVDKGGLLIPLILAGTAGDPLRPLVAMAKIAYQNRHHPLAGSFPVPLTYLAERVHLADRASAAREWWDHRRIPKTSSSTIPLTLSEGL